MSRQELTEILIQAGSKTDRVQDPEAFREAWSSAPYLDFEEKHTKSMSLWRHPDYPDEYIATMDHQALCTTLSAFQSLPKEYDLMTEGQLRDILQRVIQEEKIHRLYETQQLEKQISRRKIIINDLRLRDITDRALTVLNESNNPPFVFERGRAMVRINEDENGLPIIESLNNSGIRGVIERCCEFYKLRARDGQEIPIAPPKDVVEDLVSLPDWRIPPLRGIIECPSICSDGRVLATEGYDPDTRLYYAPVMDLQLPTIQDRPDARDIKRAVSLLTEIFCDFPFVDAASRTNMIATLMTAVLRPLIPGPVPLTIIDKPQAGTGATLLSEIIALVTTGRSASLTTAPENESEWKKTITSMLSEGRTLAIIDNVETKLVGAALASVITANIWTDRKFGRNDERITLPHSMVWLATGNNLQLGGDLPRRCYWIRLDAHSARPWQRPDEFKHPDLEKWVLQNRADIIAAILTMARGWMRGGRPLPAPNIPKIGSFESWRDTIGGILEYCQVSDFLGNLEEMYTQADTDGPQWETFFRRWYAIWGVKPVTVADLQILMHRESDSGNVAYGSERLVDLLPDVLADAWSGKKNFARVLGRTLAKLNGRVFLNGLTLEKGKTSHQAATWIVYEKPNRGGVC